MTEKEKAQDIINKMYQIDPQKGSEHARAASIIMIDEIILEREVIYASISIPPGKFWSGVRNEILYVNPSIK